jgi:eukaryotic-like serine/threonine-protein kinase
MMNPEDWQKIKLIVEDALEVVPSKRRAFLERACHGDSLLRVEVEQLLDYENSDDSFFDGNVFESFLPGLIADHRLIDQRIGNYRLIEKIGIGGMGTVYLARRADEHFEQKVALKIIRAELISDQIRQRFANERQILASLEHPNIARLIDGGTTSGNLPYLVMEYVEGASLIEYADVNDLSFNERLVLFQKTCAAVSYAHKNLVIHRDLKPSNILVGKDGEPKLLDFGIAKTLNQTNNSEFTTHNFAFTPDYASPEQIRGEKLTTATDVYSLGVILYELLTGQRPYRTTSKNINEIIKAVCETEPARPSQAAQSGKHWRETTTGSKPPEDRSPTAKNKAQITNADKLKTNSTSNQPNLRHLRGDLDNIILKALRKEPDRRYSSIEQFVEDIRLYQKGLPISASRGSFSYRATKFIKRHRLTVAFTALVVFLLLAGITATSWQAVRAERERVLAERRFENLRKISNSFVGEVHDAMRDLPGSLPARRLLVTRAAEQLDSLAADSEGNKDLQLELVWTYQNLGALPDRTLRERQEIYEKAEALARKVLDANPNDYNARNRFAMVYLDLLYVARLRADSAATLEYTQKAVESTEESVKLAPNEAKKSDDLWTVYYHYALTMQQLGKAQEAIEAARKILPAAYYLYRENPPDTGKYNFMRVHLLRTVIGNSLAYLGDYPAAIAELKAALEECRREIQIHPNEDILRRNEANINLSLAAIYIETNDLKAAREYAENALAIRHKMMSANANNYDYQIALADAEVLAGRIAAKQMQLPEATEYFHRALNRYKPIIAFDEDRKQVQIAEARAQRCLAETIIADGKTRKAVEILRQTVKFYESVNESGVHNAQLLKDRAEAFQIIGQALTIKSTANSLVSDKGQSESRRFYEESLRSWKILESGGTLRKSDDHKPAEVSQQLKLIE